MTQRNQAQINFEQMCFANAKKEDRAFHNAIPQILEMISTAINDNNHIDHANWGRTISTIREHHAIIRANGNQPFEQFNRDETNDRLKSIIMLFNSFTGLTNGRLSLVKSGARGAWGKAAYIEKFELFYVTY